MPQSSTVAPKLLKNTLFCPRFTLRCTAETKVQKVEDSSEESEDYELHCPSCQGDTECPQTLHMSPQEVLQKNSTIQTPVAQNAALATRWPQTARIGASLVSSTLVNAADT